MSPRTPIGWPRDVGPPALGDRRGPRHARGRRVSPIETGAAAGARRRAAARGSPAASSDLAHRPSCPQGLEGGQTAIRIDELPGETAFVEIGAPLVTGVHHVDSPAYDRHGNLYVTFSGSRGQQAPVAIFVVRPDGTREPFVSDVPNPTSLAFDPDGRLYVSSRFDGSVYRVEADGRASIYASDLGVACGLAFGPDGAALRRRSLGIRPARRGRRPRARCSRRCPPSVAAFHLAFGPDGHLYVTAPDAQHARRDLPDLARRRGRRRGAAGYGRPQGLAFDAAGHLYVVDALAGSSALYRVRLDAPGAPELMLVGRPADRPGLRSARRHRARRGRDRLSLAVGMRGLLP